MAVCDVLFFTRLFTGRSEYCAGCEAARLQQSQCIAQGCFSEESWSLVTLYRYVTVMLLYDLQKQTSPSARGLAVSVQSFLTPVPGSESPRNHMKRLTGRRPEKPVFTFCPQGFAVNSTLAS